MLEVSHLRAGYGAATVLEDVSISVDEGKFVVLTGPNGHGKTTLLRVLSGLLPAGERRDHVPRRAAQRASRRPPSWAAVSSTSPRATSCSWTSPWSRTCTWAPTSRRAWRSRRERIRRVYELFPRLEERRGQQARTLSGGERRMLGIGRGLMSNARLLMVDEPALGLAPVLVQEVYATLERIARSEATVLLVEETLANARDIADYVYLMDTGRIVHEGTMAEFGADVLSSTYLGNRGS